MKTNVHLLISISFLILLLGGCAKEGCTDPTAANYNSKATKNDGSCRYVCNSTDYTGYANCGSGYLAISATLCCPTNYPYHCSNSSSCYATCADAQAVCNNPSKGIYQTNGGGGSSGYNCNGSNCYSVSSGASYSTLTACQSSCGSSSAGYICNGSSCYSVSSGASYSTLSACQSACGGASTARLMIFSTKSTGGTITVYNNGSSVGTLTGYWTTTPSFGSPNTISLTLSPGYYSITAESASYTWGATVYNLASGDFRALNLQ